MKNKLFFISLELVNYVASQTLKKREAELGCKSIETCEKELLKDIADGKYPEFAQKKD